MRPALPDTKQYIDVTNNGASPLTISQIEINAPDVTVDQAAPLVVGAGQTLKLDLKFARRSLIFRMRARNRSRSPTAWCW